MTTKKPSLDANGLRKTPPRPPGYHWIRYEDEYTKLPFFVHATTQQVLWGHSIHNDAYSVFRKTRDKERGAVNKRRSNSVPDMHRSIIHHTYGRIDVALQLSEDRVYGVSPNKPKKVKSLFESPPPLPNEYEEYLLHAKLHYDYMVRFYHNNGSDYSNAKYRALHAFQFPPCGFNEEVQNLVPSGVMQKIVSNVHYQKFLKGAKVQHNMHQDHIPGYPKDGQKLNKATANNSMRVNEKVKALSSQFNPHKNQHTKGSHFARRVNPRKNDAKQTLESTARHLMAPTA